MRTDELTEVREELTLLRERLARVELENATLRAKLDPPAVRVEPVRNWDPPPYDHTAQFTAERTMPRQVLEDMQDAVVGQMQHVRQERHVETPRSVLPQASSTLPANEGERKAAGSGWSNPRPLKSGLQQ